MGQKEAAAPEAKPAAKADLSSLSTMLSARWKDNAPTESAKPEPLSASQIRSFKITKLDRDSKKIELKLV
jgi:small subunit ribosomal protein S1